MMFQTTLNVRNSITHFEKGAKNSLLKLCSKNRSVFLNIEKNQYYVFHLIKP